MISQTGDETADAGEVVDYGIEDPGVGGIATGDELTRLGKFFDEQITCHQIELKNAAETGLACHVEHIYMDGLVDGLTDPTLVEDFDITDSVEIKDLALVVFVVETNDEIRIGMDVVGFDRPVGDGAAVGRGIVVEDDLPFVLEGLLQHRKVGGLVLVGEHLAAEYLLPDDLVHLARLGIDTEICLAFEFNDAIGRGGNMDGDHAVVIKQFESHTGDGIEAKELLGGILDVQAHVGVKTADLERIEVALYALDIPLVGHAEIEGATYLGIEEGADATQDVAELLFLVGPPIVVGWEDDRLLKFDTAAFDAEIDAVLAFEVAIVIGLYL